MANKRRGLKRETVPGFRWRFVTERLWILNVYTLQLVFNLDWAFVVANNVVPWLAVAMQTGVAPANPTWMLFAADIIITAVVAVLFVVIDGARTGAPPRQLWTGRAV